MKKHPNVSFKKLTSQLKKRYQFVTVKLEAKRQKVVRVQL